MALKFGKTPGEVWMERFTAFVASGALLVGHFVLFFSISRWGDKRVAGAVAPVLCLLVWQFVSRIWTGKWAGYRFLTEDRTAREVVDIALTCAVLLNIIFCETYLFGW